MPSKSPTNNPKLARGKDKPITRNALPKLPVPATVKTVQNVPIKKSSPRPQSKGIGKLKSQPQPPKVPSEIQKLPCLNYDIVLRILHLAKAEELREQELIALRIVGEAWRIAIDNYHLPFCSEPASGWSPYISDRVPEDALARSPGKHFKFPQDSELFHEMTNHPHNPFPTRELKVWCQGSLPMLRDLESSFHSVGNHLWSLTYVIGPSLDSIRLLYNVLFKLPYLEDLRVIEAHAEAIRSELDELKKQPEVPALPKLQLPVTLTHQLTSLSVTGSKNPFILDELLEVYGRGITLECLEMQGVAARKSSLLKRERFTPNYLANIQKLKVCSVVNDILDLFSDYGWDYLLTHVSLHVNRRAGSPILSSKLENWLQDMGSVTELYLYFDHLNGIEGVEWDSNGVRKYCPKIRLYSMDSVTKLGLPYQFVELNCWNLYNCSSVEEIEFHDWADTVNKARRDANSVKFQEEEIRNVRSKLGIYSRYDQLEKITVSFGKSTNHSMVFGAEELEDDDRDYHGRSWRRW